MRHTVLLLLVLAGAVIASAWLWQRQGIPVQAAPVVTADISAFIDEQGVTRLPEPILISMPFAGLVEPITLDPGDAVTPGQVVAQISPRDLELELQQAAAQLQRLQAAVARSNDDSVEQLALQQARLFDSSMESTVEAAQQQVLAADARRTYATTQLGRVQSLFRTGAQTQDDLDQAKLAVAEREYEYSQNALVLAALRTMKQATELLPQILQQYIERRQLDAAVVQRELEEARVRYEQAELRAARGVMRVSVPAVVLERYIREAQYLAAGTRLIELGQLDQLEVEADVLSEDAVEIAPGDAAWIYGASVGATLEQALPGVVHRVAPSGFTKISSLGVEQQRVRVVVRFEQGVLQSVLSRLPLGVGYRVRLRIVTDRRSQALVIPRTALFRGADGGWQVFAVRDSRATLQDVEVGIVNDDQVEITGGLAADQQVILAPDHSIIPGTRVSVTP